MFSNKKRPLYNFQNAFTIKRTPRLIARAQAAQIRAAQQYQDGLISLSVKRRIDARANRILNADFKDPPRYVK